MGNDCVYNEQDILARVAAGDQAAFTLLVQQHTATIYAHVLAYLKNAVRSEEIVQDIFMNVWKHRTELPGIANFPGYLYVMTRNRTHSAFREKLFDVREPEKEELESNALNPAGALEYRQLSETLVRGIGLLPPRRRQVFTMSRLDGMNYEQIARELGISKSAVNQHIVEALVFLRTYLRNQSVTVIAASLFISGMLAK